MSNLSKAVTAILVLLFLAGIGFFLLPKLGYNIIPPKKPIAIIKNQKIELLVVRSQKEKEIGLSSHKNLPNNQGMLFPFDKPGYYSFWMKNMKFPIDIIYINDNKIVTIYENAKVPIVSQGNPPIYNPTSPADTVLEINAGLSKKYNL